MSTAKIAAWRQMPKACSKNVKFVYDSAIWRWMRYYGWNYGWSGRQYGLLFHDQSFEPAPEIREALRRLNLKEPHVYDERIKRIQRANIVALDNDRLPRSQWTKWDEETFYLKPYLDEIEAEKLERKASTGFTTKFSLRMGKHGDNEPVGGKH